MLAALERIADSYPDLVYVVVGDGPDRDRLRRLAGPLLEQGRVWFLGRVRREDLPDCYAAAHVFAMPARQERGGCVEGFGLVFLEAGACGTPVIGARSGGISDAVEDGINGLLVPPDDPPSLAAALGRLLDDGRLRKRLARQGLARAQSLTWARCAESILEQIEIRVARGPRRRGR
jgi:phosphatidylinositol alpha-1,6-mannosyltransferase